MLPVQSLLCLRLWIFRKPFNAEIPKIFFLIYFAGVNYARSIPHFEKEL